MARLFSAYGFRLASRVALGVAGSTAVVVAPSVCEQLCERPLDNPKIHLRYFDARGVVETTRVMLALGGQDFTEDRYKFSFEGGKPISPSFAQAKASGALNANMDRAPVLVVNGTEIGQSKAIERFLARQLGLMGRNELEAARIDAFAEHIRDLKEKYQAAKRQNDEAVLKEYFGTQLPEMLQKLEARCGSGAGVIGVTISLADVSLWQFFDDYFTDKEPAMAALEKFPNLKEAVNYVRTDRNVQNYLRDRIDTPM